MSELIGEMNKPGRYEMARYYAGCVSPTKALDVDAHQVRSAPALSPNSQAG